MPDQPYTIVIPARYASNRFPGKPLHPLNGLPMILHTAQRAAESSAEKVVVATDDERIAQVCLQEGLDVEMTSADHPSGTDRIAEVAARREWDAERVIVGLQGDEPATPARHLDLLAANLLTNPAADMATLCMRIETVEDYNDPNRVKVVRDHHDMAMYFSRASIPAQRDSLLAGKSLDESSMPASWLHIGMYAYRCRYLMHYQQLKPCPLEHEEHLEQLRVLFHGGRIHVGSVQSSPARGVDSPADVPVLEAVLSRVTQKSR
ncbi:MAG: 3-deoxy-manno-octulosonate cytidylyltransferase [Granulosicoccus sp.]